MFKGSIVAMITPFADGEVDEGAIRKLVDWHVDQGTHGIVPCGTTGEPPTLSHDEHNRVTEIVIEQAAGKLPVIAGAGSNSTREAIALTQHAKAAGADATLHVTGYYNKPNQEGIYQHFKAINDAVELPIIVYNIPPRAIVDILNAYFDAATEIIGRHNGVVTQFQGDAILAIFNVPIEDPDHARRAFEAATEILETVGTRTFAGETLAVRIGLNSGPLIAGNVGGGGRQSYTVHGDTVNLAARLEALNKEHGTGLLVSQTTAALLPDDALRRIGETEVRGLSEPVGVYTLAVPLPTADGNSN